MSSSWTPTLLSNPRESYQANIIACAVITWVIGATFVALRFYTRGCLLQNVLGAEDWLILVALVFAGATCAGMVEQAVYGLGKHALDINLAVIIPLARAGWYTILWYLLSLLFTKISILLLYLRILRYQHARYAVYAIMAIVVLTNGLWTLGTVVTACTPLRAFWEPALPNASCLPTSYWFANTALHIGTDILLYILPLPVIINLQVKTRQKIALYSILALGFSVCTISTVRLWDLIEQRTRPDFTFDNVSISYLTTIEINAAIACACCMTLKPLAIRLFPRVWGGSTAAAREVVGVEAGQGNERGLRARGPPTIGSWPSRMVGGYPRDGSGRLELLDDEWDEVAAVVVVADEKRSTETETDRGSLAEIGLEGGRSSMLREPAEVHIVEKRERIRA